MSTEPEKRRPAGMFILWLAAVSLLAAPAFGQQTYVTRYDAYTGFAFLNSSNVDLFEPGFSTQVGFRPRTWYSFGFDYTNANGDLTLSPGLLPFSLQQQLTAQLGQLAAHGLLPPGYLLLVPAHSKTQTFAVGPQLAYRHFRHATLFLRPVFAGAIHESATPKPAAGDAIAAQVVKQLAPTGTKTDTTWFFGFGGGFDILLSNHFAIRAQGDLVYDHLFNDLLRDGRFTTRFSIGPAFNFGPNIVGKSK